MKSYLTISAILIAGSVVCACKKDNETVPDAKTSLLASHPWRIVAFTDTDNTVTPPRKVDVFVTFPANARDDSYRFNADNSLLFDDGPLKRNASDAQTTAGRWQFQNDQTSLVITLGRAVALGTTGISSSSTYSLLKLSADTIRLQHGTQAQTVVVTLSR